MSSEQFCCAVGRYVCWSYGVMVSTLDSESSDPGSNPGRTSFLPRSQPDAPHPSCLSAWLANLHSFHVLDARFVPSIEFHAAM